MSRLIEVKTAKLIGPALDWAVAKAAKVPVYDMQRDWPGNYAVTEATRFDSAVIVDLTGRLTCEAGLRSTPWSPSTDWAQGGPLLEKYRFNISAHPFDTDWEAEFPWHHCGPGCSGPAPLIAFCRALVAEKLGDVVSVPAELVEAKR